MEGISLALIYRIFKAFSLECLRKTTKRLSYDSWLSGIGLNERLPESKQLKGVLTTQPLSSVKIHKRNSRENKLRLRWLSSGSERRVAW